MSLLDLRNMDCMELMAQYPDKHFELAIVDPPYGIGMDGNNNWSGSKHQIKQWDSNSPAIEYWSELFRVSKNQIIWGANHFISKIPFDSSCWIVWDKCNDGFSFADGELAWTSFRTAVRFFRFHRSLGGTNKIHPTQKPVALYKWLLHNYAKQGDKILDTHGGSMSIAIACHQMGFDLTLSELDKDYYEAGIKRVKQETAQLDVFSA